MGFCHPCLTLEVVKSCKKIASAGHTTVTKDTSGLQLAYSFGYNSTPLSVHLRPYDYPTMFLLTSDRQLLALHKYFTLPFLKTKFVAC